MQQTYMTRIIGDNMDAYFERNKNRTGGAEYPFYVARLSTGPEGYRVFYHWHYHAELLYFSAGHASVFIGNRLYEVSSGDLVFISPSEIHAVFVEQGEPSEHYIVGFDPELLNPATNLAFELKYTLPQVANLSREQEALILKADGNGHVSQLILEAYHEYCSKEPGFELAVTSDIQRLVLWVLRKLTAQGMGFMPRVDIPEGKLEAFRKALTFIHEHYCEQISAAAVAEASLMSYSHFAKLFKSVMHMPVTKYVSHLRLRKAEQLLLDSKNSITQVALDTGFSNASYFIEQFRSVKGMSPGQYRKMLLEKRY